jgi:ribosomal protein S27AE
MIRSKKCFKCNTVKPLDEFYKHAMMADGHVNKCKACNKKDVSKNRWENIEKYRDYDKQRAKLPHRLEQKLRVNRAWRAEDKRRQIAHNKVARAIVKGLLIPSPCERCGNTKSLAHHEDYDKPLEVMWLCQPCHKQRHKELKEEF